MTAIQKTDSRRTMGRTCGVGPDTRDKASPDHWYCCKCNEENDARKEGRCTDCQHEMCDTCTAD